MIIFIRYRYPNFSYGDYDKIVVGDHEKGDYYGQGRLKRIHFWQTLLNMAISAFQATRLVPAVLSLPPPIQQLDEVPPKQVTPNIMFPNQKYFSSHNPFG